MAKPIEVISYNLEAKTAVVRVHQTQRELPITNVRYAWDGAKQLTDVLEALTIDGLALKYRTGAKVWKGEFTFWVASGNINNIHTPLQHRGRFASVGVVGFYDDAREPVRSQHNGARQ